MEKRLREYKQNLIPIGISILIGLIVVVNLLVINSPRKDIRYRAVGGLIDLSTWDGKGIIALDGEWDFYPGVLLMPEDLDSHDDTSLKRGIQVPGSWIDKMEDMEGSATYRLRIKLPEDGMYAIKTRTIRLSSRFFLNENEIIRAGNPTLSLDDFIAESRYKFGVCSSRDNEIELIAHVSNYKYARAGGILRSIEFGAYDSMAKENNRALILEAMVIASTMVVGVYFLILYFLRSRTRYLLFFSGVNLLMAFYMSTMNEQLLQFIYDYGFTSRTRLQIVSMLLVSISLLQFIYHFFTPYANKKIVNTISIANLLLFLLIFRSFASMDSSYIRLVQSLVVGGYAISYLYLSYILFKAVARKADSLGCILLIANSLIFYWVTMGLKIIFEIDLGKTEVILILSAIGGAAVLVTHRLHQDYKEVNALSEKLLRQDKLKDEFLAKASHELRTPLHIILNLAKSLIEGRKGSLNPKQQEDLLYIEQEGQRLTRLVIDLLDASQIREGNLALRLGSLRPYKVIDDILKEMKSLIPEDKFILLKNQLPRDFPAIRADSDKFRQIVYNLVNNAISYTLEGEVVVFGNYTDDKAQFIVSDTGVGIEEKYFNEVFDIFYQKPVEGGESRGLGIGLSIVKHLVESQGGEISLQSVYGEGSDFAFTIPLYQGEGQEGEDEKLQGESYKKIVPQFQRQSNIYGDRPTILIVDDEPLNQKVILEILESENYNIFLADSGTEALEILEENKVDLIILDLMLPDIGGDKICKEIRRTYSMAELPILMLTASGSRSDLIRGFDYGANDFQRKPLEPEELLSRIQSLLLVKRTVEEGLEREFKYFHSQIAPHFLYNTINTIIGLSYKDQERAREALNNLSLYFRGKLDIHMEKGLIPLERELELVRAYLAIEELRYGDRLEIDYDIGEDIQAMIPPLTIQPLVENSIRHGIRKKDKGRIKISVREENGLVNIRIEDDGIGMDEDKQRELLTGGGQRIGFRNVLEKIRKLKGASFSLDSSLDKGTVVNITIAGVKYYEGNLS
ncbi:MAG: ATP-binding protein [Tissierellaceae bacterium]